MTAPKMDYVLIGAATAAFVAALVCGEPRLATIVLILFVAGALFRAVLL